MDDLRRKYQSAIAASRKAGLIGFVDERDGRLFIKGTVPTQAQANDIWIAIKHIPTWRYEVVGDIHVDAGRAGAFPPYPDDGARRRGSSRSTKPQGFVGNSQLRAR